MERNVYQVIVFLLAVYGLTVIMLEILGSFKSRRESKTKLTLILRVVNQEEVIEGIIRKILKIGWPVEMELIVIDGGSIDDTVAILNRLKTDNTFRLLSGYNQELLLKLIEQSSGQLLCYLDLEKDLELINKPEKLGKILRGIV